MQPLRLLVYDRTCSGPGPLPGLSSAWSVGARLYRQRGKIHAHYGAASWDEALERLNRHEPERAIGEIQYWGHGKWGRLLLRGESLDERALLRGHALHEKLSTLRSRLTPDARFWFRTCETFGAEPGRSFARAFTDFFERDAAGHTFVIGVWQSGLYLLRPGAEPHWSKDEGIAEGTASTPLRAHWSSPAAPNTISCFDAEIPESFGRA
jgi:hypothetical protein